MKKKNPLFFIEDILYSLEKIFKYTDNIDFDEFISNDMIKDAVERNFEIIGEAVKNLPEENSEPIIRKFRLNKLPV